MSLPEHIAQWELALEQLTEEQRHAVARAMRRQHFEARQLLFRQGDPSDALLVVEQGAARVFLVTASGGQFTIGICGKGGVLGAVAVILGKPHVLNAESIEDITVSSLPRSALLALMERIPRLAVNMNQLLARLAMESFVRSSRIIDSAPLKLGKVLREVAARGAVASEGDAYVVRGLTHQDLATMVGTSRTWVTLTLRSFERHGILSRRKSMVIIPDLQRFDQFIAALEQVSALS
jgi:CRP/FNR family transcriptional regulator, cyclic AMP receptor protein